MDRKSEESIREIGTIYMSEINKHIQQKFFTLLHLRFVQLEGVIKRTPPSSVKDRAHLLQELRLNAQVREFAYLGLYAADGAVQIIYGQPVTLANPQEFWELLKREGKAVGYGVLENGELLLVIGVPAAYPMDGGKTGEAVVAGIDVKDLGEALFVNDTDALVFSRIIDRDGHFVVRLQEKGYANYFQFIRDTFSSLGKKTALHYIAEIHDAMKTRTDYSTLVRTGDQFYHLYFSTLPNTDWFLVSELPQGVLDQTIAQLSSTRIYATLAVAGLVLLLLMFMFSYYYFLSQAQMRRLTAARQEADYASQAKSEFLSNMSHDIRTPMNAVVGMTDIALSDVSDVSRVEDCLRKIKLSSKHLLGLINDILADAGLKVEWAENGRVCVDKFQASEPGYYDAILMDLRMPEMTGYEATRAIRSLSRPDRNLPIIAMTADAFAEDVQHCLDCGMNAHTTKPINTAALFQLLYKHLK